MAIYVSSYFEELYRLKSDKLYSDIDNWYNYWDSIEFLEEPKDYSYEEPTTDTFRVVKKGEIDKWIKSRFVPIFNEKGEMIKKVGMIQDITDKKKLDEQLEDLRLEFFANLSHELRTPINLIMSAMQVVNMKLDKVHIETREDLDKYLNIVSQNSFRLLKLVNNLIDTTKIDSGSFDYSPTNQDIVSFVENICMSVVDFVERNNLDIIFDTNVEENVIGFDLDHMERIILNLISNAIKFNKENGSIEVNIGIEEDFVKISVKDEGVGIPKEKLESVFGRFEQVNKKMKREREGSGIGLALVKSLVEMHGGIIDLNSTLGQGSEFVVTLPNKIIDVGSKFDIDKSQANLNQINKMEVEFSDIYCQMKIMI